MYNSAISYYSAIKSASELAPELASFSGPSKYFAWAETVTCLLADIYGEDHETVLEDLTEAVKEYQEYETEDDDEDAA